MQVQQLPHIPPSNTLSFWQRRPNTNQQDAHSLTSCNGVITQHNAESLNGWFNSVTVSVVEQKETREDQSKKRRRLRVLRLLCRCALPAFVRARCVCVRMRTSSRVRKRRQRGATLTRRTSRATLVRVWSPSLRSSVIACQLESYKTGHHCSKTTAYCLLHL